MSVIEELIRQEDNGDLSFGNYLLETKKKVLDFEVGGDLYKVKTFKEITKLEKNGKLLLETVPGSTVHNFNMDEQSVSFTIESPEDVQITMELQPDAEYRIFLEGNNLGNIKTNLAGKVSFSVENKFKKSDIVVERIV